MGIQIGGIDITNELINTKLRLGVLEKIVQALLDQSAPLSITQNDIEKFREQTLTELQGEHPDAGIKKNNN